VTPVTEVRRSSRGVCPCRQPFARTWSRNSWPASSPSIWRSPLP